VRGWNVMNRMQIIRLAVLSAIMAGSFYYFTTHRPGQPATDFVTTLSRPDHIEITEAAAPQTFSAEEETDIELYKRVLPSVVNITATAVAFDFFYGAVPQEGQGSGFIIDHAGHILTNYHVIRQARRVEVTLSNRKKYTAAIVGVDPSNDLAVIRITARELKPAVLGDSKGLQVGQRVYAIGNPFGLGGTYTHGIISSIRPVRGRESFIDEAIQTDAAINPGNSGGPLLNSRGEVVGINTMILSNVGQSSGVGFAVPINAAKAVLNDLVTVGRVRRPTLGVRTIPIGPELAEELGLPSNHGVLLVQVIPGSSAAKAGLRGGSERAYFRNIPIMLGGDLIVAIDGREIVDQMDLARVMNARRAGDTVTVSIYRGKQKMDLKVTLEEAK
jgi:S1-C subfamily serine protease